MRTHLARLAYVWFVLALPVAVVGQDLPGLDLGEPSDTPPGEKKTETPPPSSTPTAGARSGAKKTDALGTALGTPGDRDVALGDRVKAVQRKGFLKRGRFEAGLFLSPGINDAFYQKLGLGLRVAYHVEDSLALAIRGTSYREIIPGVGFPGVIATDNVRESKLAFQSQLIKSELQRQLMAEVTWSPVYGKAAVLGRSIIHFDLFLTAGAGAVWSSTSVAPRNEGPHFATDFGGGLHFYPKDWLAVEAGLLATFFPDRPSLAVPSKMQKALVANIGVSIFFPTSFEYKNP
jgi:outer membrane beta-barrel protein